MSSNKHYLAKTLSTVVILRSGLLTTSTVTAYNSYRCTSSGQCTWGHSTGTRWCMYACAMGGLCS